ncbi:hypothetical protein L2E82_05222 [Cichorium intybus]|uniref:Uncharacterized protein n=1 Tax=Cichorium intybus TaxID=13427 RepID=A0ACB9H6H6_CICIN|nr:hypothetical protein L1887_01504 [Cichorium endivia]KAI3791453.1 hypothetical protein L2E82_05222 [Cichorium intybus]
MAASKSYYARANYRYLSGERDSSISTDSMFELDESDIWNVAASPELRKTVPSSRISKKSSAMVKRGEIGGTASSLPVNVPDWSKILKEDYRDNRRRDNDDDDDFNDYNYGEDGTGSRIPPHEFLARQLARTRIASFSVHEGIGRTLKGRDLSRVRNAIWEKTGFQD